jgi:hypothetical protein
MRELSEEEIIKIREDPDNAIWISISSHRILSLFFLKNFEIISIGIGLLIIKNYQKI